MSNTNITSVELKLTQTKKRDSKTGKYYSFNILTSVDYRKDTWNGTSYNKDGSGIMFAIPHEELKKLDFAHNVYFGRYYVDQLTNPRFCAAYDIVAKDKMSGKVSIVYAHTPKASPKQLEEISNFSEEGKPSILHAVNIL